MWIPPCSGCWAFAGPYSAEGDGAAAAAAPPPDSERAAQRNIPKSAGCLRIAATAPCSGGFCTPFSNCCNLPWQQLLQPAVAATAATCRGNNCCNLQLQQLLQPAVAATGAPLSNCYSCTTAVRVDKASFRPVAQNASARNWVPSHSLTSPGSVDSPGQERLIQACRRCNRCHRFHQHHCRYHHHHNILL
jgi:hypothetical protein